MQALSFTSIKTAVPCCFSTWYWTRQRKSSPVFKSSFMMDPCAAHQMRDSTVYKQSTNSTDRQLKVQEDDI